MRLSNREKKLVSVIVAIIVLIGIFFVMVLIAPNLTIWSIPKTYNESENAIPIDTVKEYVQDFEMPFNKLSSIEIPLESGDSGYLVSIDAKIELFDDSGALIVQKNITSVFDSSCSFKYLSVNKGEVYTLKLTVNSVGDGTGVSDAPLIKVSDDGKMMFNIMGLTGSSSNKTVFAVVYFIISMLVVAFVVLIDQEKIGDCKLADALFVGVTIIMGMILICQFNDLYDISITALKMLDSFKHGNVFGYNDYMYFNSLKNQSVLQSFACDYNFIPIFICSIFLLPVYLIYGSNITYSHGGYAVVFDLLFAILVCVLLAYAFLKRIVKACGQDDRYLSNVRALFISSSMLLYMTIGFGQIDIFYLLMIIIALPFYYRKKYPVFSIIMSIAIAMKTLPIMIFIPLILLANKKVKDIILNLVIGLFFPVITKVLFEGNVGHQMLVASSKENYGYIDRISASTIGQLSLYIFAYAIICILAYMSKTDTDDKKNMLYRSMLIIFVTYSCFAAFVDWHQQWLIPLTLAFSFLLPFHKNQKEILLLDVFAEIFFILTTNTAGVSTYMINYGIIPHLADQKYAGTSMKYLLGRLSSMAVPAVRAIFIAILAYLSWHFFRERKNYQKTYESSRTWIFGRMGVLLGFVLFYCWCFSFIG